MIASKRSDIDNDFATRDEARANIFHYIEIWCNRRRRHSTLAYLSPADFEHRPTRGKINVR